MTSRRIKKGGALRAPPFLDPRGGASRGTSGLGNVVAERSEHHVVVALRSDTDGGIAIVAGPSALGEIGILHAQLHATLWTRVELVPEAESTFLDEADVTSAIGAG